MARATTKICYSCQRAFRGRIDAKTCSETCRKRLQRAQASAEKDLLAIQRRIEESLAELEHKVAPVAAGEGGFIGEAAQPTPPPIVQPEATVAPAAVSSLDQSPLLAEAEAAVQPTILDNTSAATARNTDNYHFSLGRYRWAVTIFALVIVGLGLLAGLLNTLHHSANTGNIPVSSSLSAGSGNVSSAGTLELNNDTTIAGGKQLIATGPVLLHNASDSTSALSVQNAAGDNLLSVDTQNAAIVAQAPVHFYSGGPYFFNFQAGGLTADRTFTLPDSSGVVCVNSNNCGYASPAQLATLQSQVNSLSSGSSGGKVSSLNGLTKDVNLQGTSSQVAISVAGNTITIAGPQNLGTGSTPQFQSINLAATGTQNGFTICDSSNNCGYSTGLSGSGDANTIALFTGSNTLGDSILSQSGTTVTVTGNLSATGQYQLNGSQISSVNLSDGANLAKLNGTQTFSGANTFSSASNSFTGSFSGDGSGLTAVDAATLQGSNAAFFTNATNINTGTLNDSRLSNNVALLNAAQTFTGANTFSNASNSFTGDGSGLSSLNASNVSSGTLNNSRLNTDVALTDRNSQTFTGNQQVFQNNIDSANAFTIQNTGSNAIFTADTANNQVILGKANTLDGKLVFNSASGTGSITLALANPGSSNYTLTLPAETGTICTTATVCAGYSASAGGSGYVQLQGSTPGTAQTGNFNISGTGLAGALYQNGNQVCDTSGNCVGTGGGGGSIGGGGTAGTLAVFTASGFTIGNSLLAQSGSTVTVTGNLNATGQIQIGGSQIASSNLSDSANLAKLNGTQTFTGANTFSNASNSFTGDGSGLSNVDAVTLQGNNGAYFTNASNISTGTLSDSRLSNNVALLNGTQTFTGANTFSNASNSFTGDGSGLTSLNASNISSGTLNNSRLNSDVALTDRGSQTFTGANSFNNTSATAFQIQNASGAGNLFVADTADTRIAIGQATANYTLDVGGDINTTTGFRVAGNSGSSVTCSGGNVLQNATVTGGIITGGTCVANGGSTTLQSAYNNSGSPASITTTSASKGILFQAGIGNDSTALFQVQSASGTNALNVDTQNAIISLGGAGNVSSWSNTTLTPSTAAIYKGVVITVAGLGSTAHYLYSVGGIDNTGTVQSATNYSLLNNTGGVFGNSFTSTSALPQALYNMAGTAFYSINQTAAEVYILGGENSSNTPQSTVYYGLGSGGPISWSTSTHPLTQALAGLAATSTGKYMYAIGGSTTGAAAGAVTTVYYAPENLDGTIGSWTTSATPLPQARFMPTVAYNNGYIYVIGGQNSSGVAQSTIYYAKVNSDGSTSAWTTASNPLPLGLYGNGVGVYNGSLYVLGGVNSSGQIQTGVYSAILNSNGAVGDWQTSKLTLPQSLAYTPALVYNGYINYIYGSTDGTSAGVSTKVYYAALGATTPSVQVGGSLNVLGSSTLGASIDSTSLFQIQNASGQNLINVDSVNSIITLGNSSGDISAWKSTTNSLPSGRRQFGSTTLNGYTYVIGGINGTAQSTVYYAKLNTNGTTGAWQTNTNALTNALYTAGAASYNGYVYVAGGWDSTNTAQSTVYYAKQSSDGSLGTWYAGTSLPAARAQTSMVAYNGYLYEIGGGAIFAEQSSVNYAKINSDGSIGSWQSTNSLPNARAEFTPLILNGYVYVIGGQQSNAGTSTAYYAKINSDGSLGSWQTNSVALPNTDARNYNGAVVNGYFYIIGGEYSSAQTIYGTPNADGSVSAWFVDTNTIPTNAGSCNSGPVVANGNIYLIGGGNSSCNSGASANVYYATTSRVQVAGSLDLVGANTSGDVTSAGLGGSLTAGNTNIVGALQVQGVTSLAQGLSVGGNLTVNNSALFQNAANSTTAFQVDNAAGVSVLNVDTTTGNVGIGTISAGAKLHVASTTTSSTTLLVQQMASQTGDLFDVTNSGATVNAVKVDGANGTTTLRNFNNSSYAFQVQNTAAATLLNVNTLPPAAANLTNVITNGDFEGDITTGWAAKGSSTIGQISDAWQGAYSLRVITTTAANDGAAYAYTFAPSTTYTLSMYVDSGAGSLSDVNIGRQENGSDIDCLTAQTVTTAWKRYVCTFTTGATISGSNIYIKKTGASAEQIHVDGVQLQVNSSATAFDAGGSLQLNGIINSPVDIQNKADSSAAFQVQNAAGTVLLGVNTAGKLINIDSTAGLTFDGGAANEAIYNSAGELLIGNYAGNVQIQTNLFEVQNTTDNKVNFSMNSTGQALFKNSSDSATAFEIQSASSLTPVFDVDTSNGRIGINNSAPGFNLDVTGTGNISSALGVGGSINASSNVNVTGNISLNSTSQSASYLTKKETAGTGGVTAGDVVIIANDSGNTRVLDTTTARDSRVYGVATATTSAGTSVAVAISGDITVNADTGAINVGDQLVTSTTSGRVTANNNATTGILGIALSSKSSGSNGTVNVALRPVNGQSSPIFRNAADSSNAFQIQNAGGTSLFTADSSGMNITIGGNLIVTGNITVSGFLVTNGSYVTTLPSSGLTNGLEIYYGADPTNGVVWHLRYNSSETTYHWEYLGGSPLLATNASLTLPLAGDYSYGVSTELCASGTTAPSATYTLATTSGSLAGSTAVTQSLSQSTGTNFSTCGGGNMSGRDTGVSASASLSVGATGNSPSGGYAITVTPIRVN